MSAIVRVPEKPFKRYWIVKVYDRLLPGKDVFTVVVPSWCQHEKLMCQFPADLKVCSKVSARAVSLKPPAPDWTSHDYVFFSQTDDIKSANRRVERLRTGDGPLEESEQPTKRTPKPSQKYAENFEICEPSGSNKKSRVETQENNSVSPSAEKSKKNNEKPQSKSAGNKGKGSNQQATCNTNAAVPKSLLKDLTAPKDIFPRSTPVQDDGSNIFSATTPLAVLDVLDTANDDVEIETSRQTSTPPPKKKSTKKPAEIILTPAQMSMLLLKMDRRSKRTESMVMEIRNERSVGVLPAASLHLVEEELPAMPFNEWDELIQFEQLLYSTEGTSVKQAFLKFLNMVPGKSTIISAKNMMSAVIAVSLSQNCTFKGTSINRVTKKEKQKFSPSCPTIYSCINETCLNRHGEKFDANQFTFAMQRFFSGSGDKNGGTERRKKKSMEKKALKEKESETDENGNKKNAFYSSDEEAQNNDTSKSSRLQMRNGLNNKFVSSSEDGANSDSDHYVGLIVSSDSE